MRADVAHCQNIEIAPIQDGWVVTEGGRPAGQFDNVESAYKSALALCGTLFEQGVRSQVTERAAAA